MVTRRKLPRQISCAEALERVYAFIDDSLRKTPQEELQRHLDECRHCFDRVEFEKLVKSRLQKLRSDESPETLRKRAEELLQGF